MEEPPNDTKKFVQRQQAKLAQQALQSLWPRHDLAQSLGPKLGAGAVLL
jgi:hypothetical protein